MAGIIIAYILVERIVKALVKWYSIELYPKLSPEMRIGSEHKNLTIFRRVFDIILFIIFLLIALRYMGVEITPLIASLGIGGLAVALALQQTLGDFIAGLSIIGDKSLKIGDYVELDSGLGGSPLGGYIEDISWRTSRVRTLGNNYVIIPNTKLAQSIATDYSFGSPETFVGIELFVSYKSDLDKVEKIANKVGLDVQNTAEGAVKGYEPKIRFKKFGESNVEGAIYLKVLKFSEQYPVKHEFIKLIKKAFEKNKIEISRPIRFVYLKK
jgi:small-conductance mechanosensitive channel